MNLSSREYEFPKKLIPVLFGKSRFKVLRGGRGSGKSWGIARALLLRGVKDNIRVLCTREIQKRIEDSVHRLLSDQIELLGLSSHYDVLRDQIRGKNGTLFLFSGLSDQTAMGLKSMEGVDICWVEEAQSVSEESWKILVPTIRKPDSEIWVSFNPQLESDPTYQRFVLNQHPDTLEVEINYDENPFFNATQEADRAHDEATMRKEDYEHIWLGRPKPAVEGAIYFTAMSQMVADKRIRPVPHDPMIKTHVVFDLGYNDAMTIILAQKVSSELRIIHYIEGRQRTLADYNAELKDYRPNGQPVNWGKLYLPHDGFAKRHQTGQMDADVMRNFGWKVEQVSNIPIKQGIDRAQQMFPRVFIDEKCERLIECLKRYRWNISQKTGEGVAPLHDEFSHGADAFRYLAIAEQSMTNESWSDKPITYPTLGIV
jgi:phage terminase large subunit